MSDSAGDQKTYDMVTTHEFDAPVERVWKAWTTSEDVLRWWGPTGFTAPVAEMDVHEGGTSLVCMRAPEEFGGGDQYHTWSYHKVVPNERLEFIQRFVDEDGETLDPAALGLPAGIPIEVPHVIAFKDFGNGRSEVTVTESGYGSEQVVGISKAGMDQCLDKMAAILSG
jgi:uncharacterized protein YndB with AHSA1/START domain